jgi:hypothetical protein
MGIQVDHITMFPQAYLVLVASLLLPVCTDEATRATRFRTGPRRSIGMKHGSYSVVMILLGRSRHLR